MSIKFTALQDASILRKFTILFLLMSVIPITILYYFYIQIRDYGHLDITSTNFAVTLGLAVIGVGVGYIGMRSVIKELISMSRNSVESLQAILGSETVDAIASEENEITRLKETFGVASARLRENVRNLELAKKTLHSVLERVGSGIASMENIDSFVELILETVSEAFNAEVGVLLVADKDRQVFIVKATYGVKLPKRKKYTIKMDYGSFCQAMESRKPIIIETLEQTDLPLDIHRLLFKEPLLCAPLLLRENVTGLMVVSHKMTDEPFNDDEFQLVNNIAMQTAVAIENAKLNEDADRTYFETISALALAVEAKDKYSRGHLDRVADYAVKIARKLNLSDEDIATLRDAARLHDIGKIGIFDEVLRKPGKLTPEERSMIEKHPEIGESIIRPIRFLRNLCDIVRHHHEFLDGSGYPDGLKGEEISLLTRILTVADIYDALTTTRPYRKSMSQQEVKNILIDMKGKLDPKVVDALFEIV